MKYAARILTTVVMLALAVVSLNGCSSSSEPQTVDELMELMSARRGELQTYTLDMKMNLSMMGTAIAIQTSLQGMGERVHGEVDLSNQGMKMDMVVDAAGIMWMEMDMGGATQVMKMDMAALKNIEQPMFGGAVGGGMGPGAVQHPMDVLEQYERMYTLELGEAAEVDGEPVYTVDGTLSEEAKQKMTRSNPAMERMVGMMERLAVRIRKSDLFPLETKLFGDDGAVFVTLRNTNIVANPKLDASIFEYTPPPGVDVMDMSEMIGAQQ